MVTSKTPSHVPWAPHWDPHPFSKSGNHEVSGGKHGCEAEGVTPTKGVL